MGFFAVYLFVVDIFVCGSNVCLFSEKEGHLKQKKEEEKGKPRVKINPIYL